MKTCKDQIFAVTNATKNNGPLGLLNVVIRISTSQRGTVSQSYSGNIHIAGAHWIDPWLNQIDVRPFNLGPGQGYTHAHELSGGHLFGFRAVETTGGTDNNRDVETLFTAKIIRVEMDVSNLAITPDAKNGPQVNYQNFIQRT